VAAGAELGGARDGGCFPKLTALMVGVNIGYGTPRYPGANVAADLGRRGGTKQHGGKDLVANGRSWDALREAFRFSGSLRRYIRSVGPPTRADSSPYFRPRPAPRGRWAGGSAGAGRLRGVGGRGASRSRARRAGPPGSGSRAGTPSRAASPAGRRTRRARTAGRGRPGPPRRGRRTDTRRRCPACRSG